MVAMYTYNIGNKIPNIECREARLKNRCSKRTTIDRVLFTMLTRRYVYNVLCKIHKAKPDFVSNHFRRQNLKQTASIVCLSALVESLVRHNIPNRYFQRLTNS